MAQLIPLLLLQVNKFYGKFSVIKGRLESKSEEDSLVDQVRP